MRKSSLTFLNACLVSLFALAPSACVSPSTGTSPGEGGSGGTSSSTGNAGTTGSAGTSTSAGNAGSTGSAGTSSAGTAGVTGAAGTSATAGTAGTTGAAGTTSTSGSAGRGGTTGSAGITGAAGRGGTTGTAGTTATGNAGTTGAAGTGVRMDQAGVPLAKPGDTTNVSRKYLNLGDMRLINNRWGSDELGCAGTQQSVFINADRTLGWSFNRPVCGGAKAKPDYPEVEFGVAPFGATSPLLTTPAFSSTTLLPIQIKNITSSSVTVDQMTITLQKPTIWNIDFEVWISQRNPLTDPNPGVFAEIIAFWGWETGRWACQAAENAKPPLNAPASGAHSYRMCHQSDTWANGQWRFYNFNVNPGPLTTYNGKVDIKGFLDWTIANYPNSITREMWMTRIEIGSEIDDNTQGTVKIRNLTFEVNGTSKSVELGQ